MSAKFPNKTFHWRCELETTYIEDSHLQLCKLPWNLSWVNSDHIEEEKNVEVSPMLKTRSWSLQALPSKNTSSQGSERRGGEQFQFYLYPPIRKVHPERKDAENGKNNVILHIKNHSNNLRAANVVLFRVLTTVRFMPTPFCHRKYNMPPGFSFIWETISAMNIEFLDFLTCGIRWK